MTLTPRITFTPRDEEPACDSASGVSHFGEWQPDAEA
jgi:hypothetical protein